MRIIISPAKKMKVDTDSLPWRDLPAFLTKTEQLCTQLQGMSDVELKKLWKCNDSIAALNIQRLQNIDLHSRLTPAVLAYEGIQYQYMAPGVFTEQAFDYVQEHLRILSGFYGILKPFDGVTPYRLEMQAKLRVGECKDLYAYWGDNLAKTLFAETDCIINLASKEYSVCVSKYLPANVRFITCIFGEEKDDKVIEKGTMCKMARGEMVRYMAENQIEDPEQIKAFNRLNCRFDANRSNSETFVFICDATGS
ncbi:MAG: peroxide stress protein YaaA [Oscillospiraceae bacterium]|nr:peroxide stress protein YaaA [Oscillospiraceae bacterium]